jgi:4-amino-4-deoxy-L-arabinose transferase-like glycosyltransferase
MSLRVPTIYITSGIWIVLMGVALWTRPHLPVDETRYLAVAWEMWLRNDFLVPYLNGKPYSHKPPLLFWLMHAGWSVFGVNEWWPRLVAPLFGLGCLFLVRSLSQALWPDDKKTKDLALLILMGCLFWTLFITLTMFDMILAFFAVLGLLGIIKSCVQRQLMGFVWLALAIGLGILAKGPVILLYVLPAAFTAPLWVRRMAGIDERHLFKSFQWYGLILASIALGVVIALIWAVPAGIDGGDAYQHAIFWGQTTGRMVKSFAHQRPFWWYAALFPALTLPWCIWPPLWRAFQANGKNLWRDGSQLFCIICFATTFIVFSVISGKQLHYLLPGFPALALLSARSLSQFSNDQKPSRLLNTFPALMFVALAIILIVMPIGIPFEWLPVWDVNVNGYIGILTLIVAIWAVLFIPSSWIGSGIQLTLLPVSLIVSLHIAMAPVLWSRYDLRPISKQLKALEEAGAPLAIYAKNHGQFQFLGRLTRPIMTVGQRKGQLEDFLKNHPTGHIITYYNNAPTRLNPTDIYLSRQKFMVIWDAKTMIENPGIQNQ